MNSAPFAFCVHALAVDDRKAAARREYGAEARHDDVRVHPVDAGAGGDEAVRGEKRRVLRSPLDPADALAMCTAPGGGFEEHRLGWVHGVDPLSESAEPDRQRPGPAARIENRPWLDEETLENCEHLGWIRLAVAVTARDLLVGERPAQLPGVIDAHPIALSSRSS